MGVLTWSLSRTDFAEISSPHSEHGHGSESKPLKAKDKYELVSKIVMTQWFLWERGWQKVSKCHFGKSTGTTREWCHE